MENQIYIACWAGVVYILLAVGAVGSFIPVVPGPLLAGLAVLCFKIFVPSAEISWWLAGAAVAVAVFAQLVDIFASWIGAKKFGATWRGVFGAFVGVFAGMLIPPPMLWIFIAPLFFALAFELFGGASWRDATRAGVGAFLGTVFAAVFKFLSVVFLALWFSLEIGRIYF